VSRARQVAPSTHVQPDRRRGAGRNTGVVAGVDSGVVACILVALLAFIFAFNKLDDFDTWWHLASGRWIAAHHAVPATDVLSHTVRTHPWINLQWAFDLGLYGLFAAGGPLLPCLAGALVFMAAFVLLLRLMARHIGSSLSALVGFVVLLVAQERVALRPELVTFLLLTAVWSVLDRMRADEGRGLWWLVPLMLVWANVHALFVLGGFSIVCAMVGAVMAPGTSAALKKRLLVWGGAALAVVIVNPFTWRGVLFPLNLISRINGSSPVFAMIPEFASPFAPGAGGLAIVVYKVVLVAGGVLVALAAFTLLRRQTPKSTTSLPFHWGDVLFFAGMAVLSIAARRNVAVFAIGTAPVVARSLATLLPMSSIRASRRVPMVAMAVAVLSIAVAGAEVSGALPRWDHQPREFGAGVIDGAFPIRAVAFARAVGLPSTLYNDMAAGGYLSWDDPIGDGVFVDGRLEVYDTPYLTDYVMAESDPGRWQAAADTYGIQTAIIFHRFEGGRQVVGALATNPAWTLVYGDEVAAIFVRTAGHGDVIQRALSLRPEWDALTVAWQSKPAARWPYPAGRAEALRAYARYQATVGKADESIAAYQQFLALGVPASDEVAVRLQLARFYTNRGRLPEAREQLSRVLAIDPSNTDALALMR
jgi:hypothetical protein